MGPATFVTRVPCGTLPAGRWSTLLNMSIEEQRNEPWQLRRDLGEREMEFAAVESALRGLAPQVSKLGKVLCFGHAHALSLLKQIDHERLYSLLTDAVRLEEDIARIKPLLARFSGVL